ncbi:MAG: ester cyclase [Solirubrobacterales bacterium]|nr:ester cyclase [Solirubrobacterales bacterium]
MAARSTGRVPGGLPEVPNHGSWVRGGAMTEENTRITRRVLDELFEQGNLDAADELIHRDFVNHEAPPDNPRGPEGLKETVSWLRGLWGPMRAEIEDEICEGDKVAARVTVHGHHVGAFLGKPPTGKEYAAEQIHIWRLEDGKVIEHWSVRDDLGQALQLGLLDG